MLWILLNEPPVFSCNKNNRILRTHKPYALQNLSALYTPLVTVISARVAQLPHTAKQAKRARVVCAYAGVQREDSTTLKNH